MDVFRAFFGCRGDGGFNGCCAEASSGDGGFMLACISSRRGVIGFKAVMSLCPVREIVRPARSDGGSEREKVRPAHEKWPKNGVFWRAGRSFSRKCRWRGCAGRVFSRTGSRVILLGELCRAVALAAGPLLAVLTLQCAATPYGWHGGQPAQATTHRVNVRRMCSQRWGLESSQAPGAFHISRETTEAGSRRIPPLVACGGRAVNAEKSAPETQHPSLSLATVATGASRRTLSSSTSP